MSTQTQTEPVGLLATGGAAVPLLGVKVEAEIHAGAARVSLSQRYRNDEAAPLEAVYVFPLAARSAVNGFDVRVGDRLFAGEVKPRDEAFAAYDDALEAGFGAYLLDQERPNVFTASVGNLPPGAEVTVHLGYVSELDWEGDTIRFVLPTTISPRYVSEEELERRQVGQPEHERVTPPVALSSVASPSHPIAIAWSGTTAAVELAQESAALDRDFVLLLTPRDAAQPAAVAEREPGGGVTAMVTILPDFDAPRTPQEVVFVVDCSGSMDGDSIAEARRALQLCLRQLEEGDRFNLVRFGSEHTALWPAPAIYNRETFEQADRYAAGMYADLGGTEILRPLQEVLPAPAGDRVRQVLLLTDGEVSRDDEVIALAREHADHARVFTFGIGMGSNEHLCRGVAEASRGAAEFIYPGERIEPKVLRQFGRLALPQAGGVKVAGGTPVPDPVPPLFHGERVTFFVRCPADVPAEVVVTADGGRRWSVPLPAAVEGELLGTLCARREIEALERDTPARAGSQQAGRRRERNAARLRELALKYRLMSSETSFVVVEERPEGERVEQPAQLRRVA
ncbi:MAG: VWA domain-containing protein, partial [Armatimonadetes bacterium]|nr:VWA domain-containing protein [Armatimonadota bacterium]